MGRSPMLPQKQSRPDPNARLPQAPEVERKFYEVIKSKENMGIWVNDLKRETGMHDPKVAEKALKSLQLKKLVKLVANVHSKGKKMYMAVEFEPAKEISGGLWYTNGDMDKEFFQILRAQCMKHVERLMVATLEMIHRSIEDSGVFNTQCTMQQILEMLRWMVLDKVVEELKSSGRGDFSNVPSGKVCYRSLRGRNSPTVGSLSSVPCGVCPRISECTPDGIISPNNCVYYSKWLDLQF